MKSKDKNLGGENRSRGIHKPKTVNVAEGSLQSRAPGAVMPGGPESPFRMAHTGSQQSDQSRNQRGGVGASQNGWSARQRGERMQAQAEQNRLGEAQQSGQGGGSLQGSREQPASDSGSKRSTKNPGR